MLSPYPKIPDSSQKHLYLTHHDHWNNIKTDLLKSK